MGKTVVRSKLLKAFADLEADIKKDSCGLYIVNYDSMEYFVDFDENEGAFCILQTVMGLDGELSQSEFDVMLDVVRNFHKEYNGEWNDGVSYVYSPWYYINKSNEFNSKSLERNIKDFFEAWSFACANACLITDTSIWKQT